MVELTYLCTSTEASWVKEREDIQRYDPGQNTGKVQPFLRHLSAQSLSKVLQLGHRATGKEILQHLLPLAIRPLIKLRNRLVHGLKKYALGGNVHATQEVQKDRKSNIIPYPLANQISPFFKDLQY